MTQDKIIAAARSAGWSGLQLQMASPAELDRLAAFYRLAYRAGMERAAKICEEEALRFEPSRDFSLCIAAIRAHAKNQTEGRATNG